MSLTRLAEESLAKYGEYVALAFEGRQYTNVEQDLAARRIANALRRLGIVVLKDGERASPEELIALCQSRVARFKCPKQVRFMDSLPKSPIGKILRKELRKQA